MDQQLNVSVLTDSGPKACCVQLTDRITCQEIREEIEVINCKVIELQNQANIPHGCITLYSKPFYLCDNMLFQDLYQSKNEIGQLDICYGDSWRIFIMMKNQLVFAIPLTSYSSSQCTDQIIEVIVDGESDLQDVMDLKNKDFLITFESIIEDITLVEEKKAVILSISVELF